jgi:glycosyltransferase involved in cell wall biosynthesis
MLDENIEAVDLEQSTKFVLLANVVDGFESEFEYLTKYLCERGIESVSTISQPLDSRSSPFTVFRSFVRGVAGPVYRWRRPHKPPFTHVFDFVYPPKSLKGDIWIAFNPVQAAIARLRMNRKSLLVHWAIDFVPHKSSNPVVNCCYRFIERFMFKRVDVQIENSRAALKMRQELLKRKPSYHGIAPIGVFETDFVAPILERLTSPKVVYFGSIDDRNDGQFVAEVARELCIADSEVSFHFVGSGPLESALKIQLSDLVVGSRVVFHGFVRDQSTITNLLGECAVAIAPFLNDDKQFTKFADPQKIKYYLAAGLPIFLTDVPPNAQELVERAGCSIMSKQDGAVHWAQQILSLVHSPTDWLSRANLAYQVGTEYERTKIYDRTLQIIASAFSEKSNT